DARSVSSTRVRAATALSPPRRSCRVEDEQADEHDPQRTERATGIVSEQRRKDQQGSAAAHGEDGERAADDDRPACGARATAQHPEAAPQETSTVHRERGDEIEESQQEV